MEHLRAEIWDHLFQYGPQTVEQIANNFSVDTGTVSAVIEHDWFDVLDSKVQIAHRKPPSSQRVISE